MDGKTNNTHWRKRVHTTKTRKTTLTREGKRWTWEGSNTITNNGQTQSIGKKNKKIKIKEGKEQEQPRPDKTVDALTGHIRLHTLLR